MKRIFSFFCQRSVLFFLVAMLLSLVVWFEAPLLAFDGHAPFGSERVRWVCILLVWICWLYHRAVSVLRPILARRREARRLKEAEAQQRDTPERACAMARAELELGMRHALTALRRDRHLPWYVLLGAQGSGKSAVLARCGMKLTHAGRDRAHGATRRCEWWFGERAVLLDTPGAYADEAHGHAWGDLLNVLARLGRRDPLSGIIVTLSVDELLESDGDARAALAQRLRERMGQAHDALGRRVPVYLLVTKCDLLAGFAHSVASTVGDDNEQGEQVWGATFGFDGATPATFAAEFKLLELQLQRRLFDRMQRARDVERRALIYGFPHQFARLRELLHDFVRDAFEASRFEHQPLLRGVYFSSSASAHGSFLARLFQEVIFPDAGLRRFDPAAGRRRSAFRYGALAASALLVISLAAGVGTSYARNRALVSGAAVASADLATRVAAIPAGGADAPLLAALDAARQLAGDVDEPRQVPWRARLGMYQGSKLDGAGRVAYQALLRDTLLPRMMQSIENRLRQATDDDSDLLYDALRVYLMLGDARRLDVEHVAAWLATHRNGAVDVALARHERALLTSLRDGIATPRLDPGVVETTRLALARLPPAQRLYRQISRQVDGLALPEVSVTSSAGPAAASLLVRRSGEPITRGVNGMFTLAGHGAVLELSRAAVSGLRQEQWILGKQEALTLEANQEPLRQAVLQLYYDDYIAQWDALLGDVTGAPFASLEQGARISRALSEPASPLRKFMLAASRETTPGAPAQPAAASSVAAAVKGKLTDYKQRLQGAFSAAGATGSKLPAHPVDVHFDALHRLTAGAPSALDQSLALLGDAAVDLDAAAAARLSGTPAPPGAALNRVRLEGAASPAPLQEVFKQIDARASGFTAGSERERLNALWTAGPAQFCRKVAAGRYPIMRGAQADMLPEDFAKLFGPGGAIDDFFQKNLLQHVDASARPWRWRDGASRQALGMNPATLASFEHAAAIRDSWFAAGQGQPLVRFVLSAKALDPGVDKLMFEIDGQPLRALPDRSVSGNFQLPGAAGAGTVRLELSAAGVPAVLQTEGPWAWLRMLDKAAVTATPLPEKYKLAFRAGGKLAEFDMSASTVNNAFQRASLERFRCADQL
ncbi:MAG TPA: type VI secretion system membrane subunit TssM [Telluria sp.]|jgi:type VI secretion system protein ImpL